MKFGGTSVGSASAIRQAARIILDQSSRWGGVVVIVSAMGGVTDKLVRGAHTAASSDGETFRLIAAELAELHTRAADELVPPGSELHSQFLHTLDRYLAEFSTLCHSVSVLGELTPRAMDTISGLGERINARLCAATLEALGGRAQAIDATELIVTDDHFQSAAPLMALTRPRTLGRLGPLLEQGVIPVVTGFIAATAEGISTTLGRGGSDYSAAILGDALDAAEVWIWTDVDGVMTADPRVVPEAQVIPVLSYSEVGELAYFGAKVLHPRTIRPVVERGIPLWVKNTFNPDFPGTLVERQAQSVAGTVKAVTAIKGLSMVIVEGRGMMGVPGIAARTFGAVASQGASVLMISQASSEQSICFIVPQETAQGVMRAVENEMRDELRRGDIDRVTSMDEVVIVTAVGAGMRGTPGVASRLFGALGDNGINVIAIAQGASECGVSMVIAAPDAPEALRRIHERVILKK
jgi:bifunctional aspartokinase / homoserine dehydrogenase 1